MPGELSIILRSTRPNSHSHRLIAYKIIPGAYKRHKVAQWSVKLSALVVLTIVKIRYSPFYHLSANAGQNPYSQFAKQMDKYRYTIGSRKCN